MTDLIQVFSGPRGTYGAFTVITSPEWQNTALSFSADNGRVSFQTLLPLDDVPSLINALQNALDLHKGTSHGNPASE